MICDSDETKTRKDSKSEINTRDNIKRRKKECLDESIAMIAWEDDNALEDQIFKDINWEDIIELLKSVGKPRYLKTQNLKNDEEDRKKIASYSISERLFKRIDKGEIMGKIIFQNIDKLPNDRYFKQQFLKLENWVEGNE